MGFDADMRTNKGKKTRERGGDHSINLLGGNYLVEGLPQVGNLVIVPHNAD